jgi:hypothetical protein
MKVIRGGRPFLSALSLLFGTVGRIYMRNLILFRTSIVLMVDCMGAVRDLALGLSCNVCRSYFI